MSNVNYPKTNVGVIAFEEATKIKFEETPIMDLVGKIRELCKNTWSEGLDSKLHNKKQWTYSGMLRLLGIEIENEYSEEKKDSRRLGHLIYENAGEKLIKEIRSLYVTVCTRGKTEKLTKREWTLNGMLNHLGRVIALNAGSKLPV